MDDTHVCFWVSSCQTTTPADRYTYSFKLLKSKQVMKGVRNCEPADTSVGMMRELKRGFLLDKSLMDVAAVEDNQLCYRVSIRKH